MERGFYLAFTAFTGDDVSSCFTHMHLYANQESRKERKEKEREEEKKDSF